MAESLAKNNPLAKPVKWYASSRALDLFEKLLGNSLLATSVILVIVFSILGWERNFLSIDNLLNILLSMVVTGFLTWALAIAMLAGNTDFSVTGISGISTVLVGVLVMNLNWSGWQTIIGICAFAILVSLFTSVLIVNFRIPSIVATIAVNGSYIALAMYLCNNLQINIRRPELENILLAFSPLGIPFSIWLMFSFFGIAYVMLYHTKLGAHIYAVGANPTAARLNGVPINRTIRVTLMWSALCVALATIVQTTRSGITMLYGSTGGFAPFTALGPVMLGGISLFGGRGRVENMLVAIIFTSILFNGLVMMGATTGLIQLCDGLVFLLALMMSAARDWLAQRRAG